MKGKKLTTSHLLMGILAIVFITASAHQPAFAERNISFEKVLDINKDSFQAVMLDLKNMPLIFPDFIESVEPTNNEEIANIVLNLNGFHIYSKIKYSDERVDWHTLEVITGDMRGTKLSTKLDETWGFSGAPNQGTIVNIEMDLQYSGWSSFLGFVSDDTLRYSMNKFLTSTVSFANSNNEDDSQSQENIVDDENESNYKTSKKGHRPRR